MTILPIRITGDPVLHFPASPVTEFDDTLRTLVSDMFETMDAAPGVGLAAPQVGVGLRLFVYSYDTDEGEPWRGVAINPELWITPLPAGAPEDELDSEGCLSVPHERKTLARHRQAPLRVEFDHLDGVLYSDRLVAPFYKTVQKAIKKAGWGVDGISWMPGVDDLDA